MPAKSSSLLTKRLLRHVDNAQQAQRIGRVKNYAQIGNDVFNFLALVEFKPAYHIVADAAFNQHFFKNTALRVGAVQNCHIAQLFVFGALQILQLFNYKACLVALVHRLKINNIGAALVFRPQIFRLAAGIVFYNRIGSVSAYCGSFVPA